MKITKLLKIFVCTISLLCTVPTYADSAVVDTAITGMIKTKIMMDQSLSNSEVNVTTNNGVVTLAGTVKTDADAGALIQLAQATSGVKDVQTSQLKVADSKHPFTDTSITAKVKGLFIREKIAGENIAAMSIKVETNNGIVSLTGTADNQQQIDNAVKLAKSVSGVKSVESRVDVMKK